MLKTRYTLTLLASAALLASCGGGSSEPPFNLNGLAATGAAVANKAISIKCASGTASATTDANGRFDVKLQGPILPCMLEVDAGAMGKLHGLPQRKAA